jgi:hypothetical protein
MPRLARSYSRVAPLPYEQPPGAEHTLAETFEELLLPELKAKGRKPDTIAEYRTHLRRWDEYWESQKPLQIEKHRITNPVLCEVTRAALLEWRSHLADTLDELGPRTLNKHLGTVHAVLAAAVKHGWLWGAPKLEPLKHAKAARKLYLTYEQLGRLYEACERAEWPPREGARGDRRHYPPSIEWQAALVLFFNYGFRTQELVRYEGDMRTLTWGQISFARETPAEEGHATCEHGWLWYVPEKQQWQKDDVLVLPLNAVVRAHLEAIRPPGPVDPATPVIDWPLNAVALYGQWRALLAIAEVRPKPNLKTGAQESYHIKHLRKTCTTWHNFYCRGIAPFITGHAADRDEDAADRAASRVSLAHYEHGENAVVKALREFPQPEPFTRILKRG